MDAAHLSHAAAFARELDAEVQRLDALQQVYVQQLVDQLSDMSFLTDGTDATLPPQSVHFPLAEPSSMRSTTTASYNNGGLFFWKADAMGRENAERSPYRPRGDEEKGVAPRDCSQTYGPTASSSNSAAIHNEAPPHYCNETRSSTQVTLSREAGGSVTPAPQRRARRESASPPAQLETPPPLPPPVSRREEEARRARRALRCIREDRDAHFNAKARRAEELLKEGREAVRKSRERRLADTAAVPAARKAKA